MNRSKIVAIVTGIISLVLGILYLILVQLLDMRGEMIPAPQVMLHPSIGLASNTTQVVDPPDFCLQLLNNVKKNSMTSNCKRSVC